MTPTPDEIRKIEYEDMLFVAEEIGQNEVEELSATAFDYLRCHETAPEKIPALEASFLRHARNIVTIRAISKALMECLDEETDE